MRATTIWLLAALLATGVAAEIIWPDTEAPAGAPTPAATHAAATQPAVEPVADWTGAILARPLFEPDRRPKARAAVAASGPAAQQEPPRLTGILVTPQGSHAIFAGEGEHSTIAGEGAHVGAWQVVAIHHGDVQLAGPDGARTVKPSYSNAAPGVGPTTASAVPPPFNPGAVVSGDDIFRNAQKALTKSQGR